MNVGDDPADQSGAIAQVALGHSAAGLGLFAAALRAGLVDAVDGPLDEHLQVAVAEVTELAGNLDVRRESILTGEVPGPVGDDLGASLVDVASGESGKGGRQIVDQGAGQAELPGRRSGVTGDGATPISRRPRLEVRDQARVGVGVVAVVVRSRR